MEKSGVVVVLVIKADLSTSFLTFISSKVWQEFKTTLFWYFIGSMKKQNRKVFYPIFLQNYWHLKIHANMRKVWPFENRYKCAQIYPKFTAVFFIQLLEKKVQIQINQLQSTWESILVT